MATTADFKNGLCIEFNNELWTIVEFQHVKPGKGPAFVRTRIRNLKTGRVLENTFTAGVKIDLARVERRPYQFLYKEGDNTYTFMHNETYEQLEIQGELINNSGLLKEGKLSKLCITLIPILPYHANFLLLLIWKSLILNPVLRVTLLLMQLKELLLKPEQKSLFHFLLKPEKKLKLILVPTNIRKE